MTKIDYYSFHLYLSLRRTCGHKKKKIKLNISKRTQSYQKRMVVLHFAQNNFQ